jgi:nucleotide-binding universal stress UspA family protein
MKTIVALVDFSDVTTQVVQHAQKVAQAFGSRLVVVHVLERRPVVVDLGIASPTIMQAPTEEAVRADQARLLDLQANLSSAGVTVETQQWNDLGADQVVEHLRRLTPDLVVVGSHHHGSLFKLLVGGLGSDLLKHAPCPVLVVPKVEAAG